MYNRHAAWLSFMLAAMLVISGCYASSAVGQPPAPSEMKQEDIMSAQEQNMVVLFQCLVQMDKEEGLRLSKQQAKELLPLVKRNSTDGEISQADQQSIMTLLTTNQKSYVDHFQEHLLIRKLEKKPTEHMTPDQREQMIKEFQSRRQENEKEQQNDSTANEPSVVETTDTSVDSLIPNSGYKVPDNVEQQLMELLDERIRTG